MAKRHKSKKNNKKHRNRPTNNKDHAVERAINQLTNGKYQSILLNKEVDLKELPVSERRNAIHACLKGSPRRNKIIARHKLSNNQIKVLSNEDTLEIAVQIIEEKLDKMRVDTNDS